MKFGKKNDTKLDSQVANQMLANVFNACQKEPNNVPLDVLTSYSNYRKERYTLQKVLLIIILSVFLMMPLLFFYPHISVVMTGDAETSNPIYEIEVSGFIPIRRMNAVISGRNIPIYETGSRKYVIQPTMNGDMTVTATFLNMQQSEKMINVSTVDGDQPILILSETDDDYVYLYVSDADSGIDFEGVYIKDVSGTKRRPYAVDESKGLIQIEYPETTVNVFVPDKVGNTLQLLLTLQ